MVGYTDPPYRELMKEFGTPVLFTEMIDSHALIYRNEKTIKMLGRRHSDLHTQIAAGTSAMARRATDILLEHQTAGINLNMGCPAKKVVSCGGGSNLLRAPSIIRDICATVRKATKLPFSVKFRSGWNADCINFREIGKIYEGEGIDFIILHARTRAEAFSGTAHWDHIRELKRTVKIPVIGNGDVVSYESAKDLFDQTGCDGIAIGRGAIGNPWLFLQAEAACKGLPPQPEPAPSERFRIISRHYELMNEFFGVETSSHLFRKHLVGYLKGLPGHKAVKENLFVDKLLTHERLMNTLGDYFHRLESLELAAHAPTAICA